MTHNEPSTELSTSWLVRAYHTPIADAMRGNLSARLDPRAAILGMNLPMSLAELVLTVVRRTRLWRSEKVDVARELAAHFADGLASGRTVEQLTRDFGDPRRAAKLIRNAKRRNRPWPWQVWHYSLRTLLITVAVCLALYSLLAVRFYLGKPTLSHNYWEEINEARRVPESERAWPVYRDTQLKLGRPDRSVNRVHYHCDHGPDCPYWANIVAYIDRHQDAIGALREATKKPRMAFYVGDKADLAAATARDGFWLVPKDMALASENKAAISIRLYGLQEVRGIARILVADAHVAASRNEGARAAEDITALIALAEQQRNEPRATLVEQLVGIAIFEVATNTLGQLLVESPAIFNDAQLVILAHRLAGHQNGKVGADLSSEKMMFDDVLQRSYTDDGRGDGRVTFDGFKLLNDYSGGDLARVGIIARSPDLQAKLFAGALCPALSTIVGRRGDMSEKYYELIDDMIANHQGPSWQWDRNKIEAGENRLKALGAGINKPRYCVVNLFLPHVSAVYSATERTLQRRDAAETMIALELWRRRHGDWPERLDQLVPDLLPEVPRDRVDGQPLRYVIRDEQPVLYSIGVDRRDDGGKLNADDPNRPIPGNFGPPPKAWAKDPALDASGDWILWPPQREKNQEDDGYDVPSPAET